MRIDAAFVRLLLAPDEPAWQLTAAQAEELAAKRLRAARCWEVVEEGWPLLQVRHEVAAQEGETAIALPFALPCQRSWALLRTATGVARLPLEPLQATLLTALCAESFAAALARVEADCPVDDRDTLPRRTQQWLAQSATLGLFCGVDDA